jgi:redox-sensitive bicupin YhaK (pirin superfamily)
MSAGTGVTHSEYNHEDEPIELFQVWIEPKSHGIAPRYDQKAFDFDLAQNKLVLVVSPDGRDGSLAIHQNARIFRGVYQEAARETYTITPGNGIYLIMLAGEVRVGEITLTQGDALSVSEESAVNLDMSAGSDFILLEIPPFHETL